MDTPQRQPLPSEAERYARALHTVALVTVVACPTLALLPPRKLDIYTVGLISMTGYSANHLIRESTGRSIWQHVTRQPAASPATRITSQPTSLIGDVQAQARGGNAITAPVGTLQRQREEWKIQRQNEIKEEIEEGKGFGDMIMDQIWEVWNWGKPKDEEENDDK